VACTPSVPPVEDCDGVDDDCNGLTDDAGGFDCVLGATESCTTSCESIGERTCTSSCTWPECVPPAETCDGADQDCDGVADDDAFRVVWDVEAVEGSTEATIVDFSVAVAGGEAGLGYILATGADRSKGQPRLARARLVDGGAPTGAVVLATGNVAYEMAAAGIGTTASFGWSSSDGAPVGGETMSVRSALLGTGYSLGGATTVDPSDQDPSMGPAVVRSSTSDLVYVAWIESVVGLPSLQLVGVESRAAPAVSTSAVVGSAVGPRSPSLAVVHPGDVLLVAWAAGSPGNIHAQRLDGGLVPQGLVIDLTVSSAPSERPRTTASGDGFMVVWEEGTGVMLAVLDADGETRTAATMLIADDARAPVVASDLVGGFAVAYQRAAGVELVRLSARGDRQGEPLFFSGGARPELAAIPGGGLVLAFQVEGSVRLARVGCPL
jgi:hypothetical protein